MNGSGYSPV
jgi:hypothetical protein